MKLDDFTLIIPTYNRYDFLLRLLKFYKSYNFPFKIIVLDSTSDQLRPPALQELLDHKAVTCYLFLSYRSLEYKIAEGLKFLTTPYSAICADDDFLIPTGINECVAFLKDNQDYSCAQGFYIHHVLKGKEFNFSPLYPHMGSNEYQYPQTRVFAYLIRGRQFGGQHFYAVHRTETLRMIFKETAKYATGLCINELFAGVMSLIYGKRKMLNVFYGSREPHCKSPIDLEYMKTRYSPDNVKKMVEGIGIRLKKADVFGAESVAEGMMRTFVKNEFNSYRFKTNNSFRDKMKTEFMKLRGKIILRKHKMRVTTLLNSQKHHRDYVEVRRAVLSAGLGESDSGKIRKGNK